MRIDLEATRKVVARALDLGITLFDTADIYGGMGGSETMLGQVLGERRKDIVLATKFAGPMAEGRTLLELAFSWLLARPPVASVIAGATKPEQLDANAKAAGWALTPEDLAEIDAMPKGHVNPL